MQRIVTGNILAVQSGVVLHQVNAQGVMGSGVAVALRATYPQVWVDYSRDIHPNPTPDEARLRLGRVIWTKATDTLSIASLVGQQNAGKDGAKYTSYDALDTALMRVNAALDERASIHYPLIGAGLGGGRWTIIKEIIAYRLAAHDLTLWLMPGVKEPQA